MEMPPYDLQLGQIHLGIENLHKGYIAGIGDGGYHPGCGRFFFGLESINAIGQSHEDDLGFGHVGFDNEIVHQDGIVHHYIPRRQPQALGVGEIGFVADGERAARSLGITQSRNGHHADGIIARYGDIHNAQMGVDHPFERVFQLKGKQLRCFREPEGFAGALGARQNRQAQGRKIDQSFHHFHPQFWV